MLAAEAAIMEPDPTPAPMARASGSKIFQLATSEVRSVMNTAPNSVPKTYMASTPRYWSESGPYFSETMANDGSRSRENVAPTVALPIRSRTARGRASMIGAQQVAYLLKEQRRPGLDEAGKAGADVEGQPGHQEQDGHTHQGGRHPLEVQAQGLELLDGDQKAENEPPDHGEDDDRADAEVDFGLADELDRDGDDQGQRGNRDGQLGAGLVYPRLL